MYCFISNHYHTMGIRYVLDPPTVWVKTHGNLMGFTDNRENTHKPRYSGLCTTGFVMVFFRKHSETEKSFVLKEIHLLYLCFCDLSPCSCQITVFILLLLRYIYCHVHSLRFIHTISKTESTCSLMSLVCCLMQQISFVYTSPFILKI